MAIDSSEEDRPSFFKVVRYPSASHLALPTAFVRRYLEKIPKTPIVKTETGEHSWSLKIKKIGDGYCFSNGWEKLAKDAQLRIRDIVVFSLMDPFTFEVSFFDVNGCEKDLPLNNTNFSGDADEEDEEDVEVVEEEEDDDEVVAEEEEDDDEDELKENLCFQKVISDKSNRYILGLPKKFVMAAELEDKRSIKMMDHEGKEWIIGLLVEKFHNRLNLSSGWSNFRQHYNISEGDVCLFKFIKEQGVLSLAQLLKNKRPRKHETPAANMDHGVKRKRGRPRLQKPTGGGGGGGVNLKIEHEAGVVKRKRGRPPLVKIENKSEMVKRKRGRPPLVKIENKSEMVKRKRGRPRIEKHGGGGGGVKIEDGRGAEVETVKRKRGRPRVERGGGGVKIEDGPGAEVWAAKRKRGRPRIEKGGGGGVKIKSEDGDGSMVKRKIEKGGGSGGGGVVVKTESGAEEEEEEVVVVKRKRGRPPLRKEGHVIYF